MTYGASLGCIVLSLSDGQLWVTSLLGGLVLKRSEKDTAV
jgi:hypothetical protein